MVRSNIPNESIRKICQTAIKQQLPTVSVEGSPGGHQRQSVAAVQGRSAVGNVAAPTPQANGNGTVSNSLKV